MDIKITLRPFIALLLFFLPFSAFAGSAPADPKQLKELCDEVISEKKLDQQRAEKEACADILTAAKYLDELYKPLVPKGKFLLEEEFYYFGQFNYGNNSSAAVQKVLSNQYFTSLKNYLAFSPLENFELAIGYRGTFPAQYDRSGFDPQSQEVIIKDTISSQYLQEYSLNSRLRLDAMELYLNALEVRQRTKLDEVEPATDTRSFNKTRTHYEDFKIGARFIGKPAIEAKESNLSKLTRPLLAKGQINAEAEVSSKKAGQAKKFDYYNSATLKDGYLNRRLGQYFIPSLNFRYGLSENIETDIGLQYTTPYKFKHMYRLGYLNGTYTDQNAAYRISDKFYMPLKAYWRPEDNLELRLSSDLSYGRQRLDYSERATNGTVTNYPAKKLSYINTVPTLNLAYLYENNAEIKKDIFAGLTDTFLSRGQALLEFEFKKDITHLYKNAANTTQNIFDPGSVFLYPLDTFMTGTEYAAFNAENNTLHSSSVPKQNCFYVKGSLNYGLFDKLNLGMALGYRSESYVHTFRISAFDDVYYKLYPYYFVDASFSWHTTKNSLIVFKSHFVPIYKIRSHTYNAGSPKDYQTQSHYTEASIAWKGLF